MADSTTALIPRVILRLALRLLLMTTTTSLDVSADQSSVRFSRWLGNSEHLCLSIICAHASCSNSQRSVACIHRWWSRRLSACLSVSVTVSHRIRSAAAAAADDDADACCLPLLCTNRRCCSVGGRDHDAGDNSYSPLTLLNYTGWAKINGATLHFPKYLENYWR